jgi:hypothetical protein
MAYFLSGVFNMNILKINFTSFTLKVNDVMWYKFILGDDDGCKEDLRNAANLGGQFAKQLLVSMNPYAALCNQMLGEVIGKLRSGEGDLPME